MVSKNFDENTSIPIEEALLSLPLFDNIYLRMQALNLALVDEFLMGLEQQLLDEYIELERTPVQSALFVSARSQLWLFGLYDLLRTWRQKTREIMLFINELDSLSDSERENRILKQKQRIEKSSPHMEGADSMHWRPFEMAIQDQDFLKRLTKAFDMSERLFRRIESLRVSIAKHEVPRSKATSAMAPGYGRIDMTNSSIYWQVILKGNEVDLASGRAIADECRKLTEERTLAILPKAMQIKLRQLPEYSYGIKRVDLVIEDGTKYKDVYIAWNKEIVLVSNFKSVPFDVEKVVDVKTHTD